MADKRRCSRCCETFPTAQFSTTRRKKVNGEYAPAFNSWCKVCCVQWQRERRRTHGRLVCELDRSRHVRIRAKVIAAYGSACRCCGEDNVAFLAIDHIAGDGAAHRREIGGNLAHWLYTNKYPAGYQLLCHNCNWSKGVGTHCLHQDFNLIDMLRDLEGVYG